MSKYTRQKGKITLPRTAENTFWVVVDFKGSQQGFGGLYLDDADMLQKYIADICQTFGVDSVEELDGKECYALRCWDEHQTEIEGLESELGKRFTHTAWRAKHFPGIFDSPLEARRKSFEQRLVYLRNEIASIEKDLPTLDARYCNWEEPNDFGTTPHPPVSH